jgi:predicted DNA-binding protein YlxM (UPF0122 family)
MADELTGNPQTNEQEVVNDNTIPNKTKNNLNKGGRPFKKDAKTEARRDFVWGLMKQRGVHNFPIKDVADKFNVSEMAIYADISKNLDRMPLPLIEKEAKSLLLAYNRAISQAFRLLEVNIPTYQEPVKIATEADKDYNRRCLEAERNYFMHRTQTIQTISDGISKLLLATKEYTEFLEKYGFKEKIAEKLEIKEVSIHKVLMVMEKLENEGRKILSYDDFAEE